MAKASSTPQRKLVVANWKMNPATLERAERLFLESKDAAKQLRRVRTVIAPPTLYLSALTKHYRGARLALGAQDAFWEKTGSYTGEVSAAMLAAMGADYVIVGHSERRAQGEKNEEVAKKARAVLKAGMTPIICVGEDERDDEGEYVNALRKELRESIAGIARAGLSRTYIAYEPRWAIGGSSENALTPEGVHTTSLILKKELAELFDTKMGTNAHILYGGSAEADNAGALVRDGKVEGLLVGHASLQANSFSKLLRAVEEASR